MDSFFRRFFPEDANALDGYHLEIQRRLTEQAAVLDLGCGDNRQLAKYRSPRRQVWGADFHRHPQLKHDEWFRLLGADGRIPFAGGSFDLVAACWVLEHIRDPQAFLGEVARVLRPGGHLVALTINAAHYVTWMIRLIHLLPHAFTQEIVRRLYGRSHHDTFPTHYRLNTAGQIKKTVGPTGLDLTASVYFANPDYFSFSKPLRRAAIVADWFLEEWFPGMGKLYVVTVMQKRQSRTDLPGPQVAA
ncbi:MAG: class I SAM-dependent methyltransferase [Gemmataceae bacterium]